MLLHSASFCFSLSLSHLLVCLFISHPLELLSLFDKSIQPTQTKDDSFTKRSQVKNWTVTLLCFYTTLPDLMWKKLLLRMWWIAVRSTLGWNLLTSCAAFGFSWGNVTAEQRNQLREVLSVKIFCLVDFGMSQNDEASQHEKSSELIDLPCLREVPETFPSVKFSAFYRTL